MLRVIVRAYFLQVVVQNIHGDEKNTCALSIHKKPEDAVVEERGKE